MRIICFSRECEEFRYQVFVKLRIALYTFGQHVFIYVRFSYGCAPRVLCPVVEFRVPKLRVGVGVTQQPQRMLQQHSKVRCWLGRVRRKVAAAAAAAFRDAAAAAAEDAAGRGPQGHHGAGRVGLTSCRCSRATGRCFSRCCRGCCGSGSPSVKDCCSSLRGCCSSL